MRSVVPVPDGVSCVIHGPPPQRGIHHVGPGILELIRRRVRLRGPAAKLPTAGLGHGGTTACAVLVPARRHTVRSRERRALVQRRRAWRAANLTAAGLGHGGTTACPILESPRRVAVGPELLLAKFEIVELRRHSDGGANVHLQLRVNGHHSLSRRDEERVMPVAWTCGSIQVSPHVG